MNMRWNFKRVKSKGDLPDSPVVIEGWEQLWNSNGYLVHFSLRFKKSAINVYVISPFNRYSQGTGTYHQQCRAEKHLACTCLMANSVQRSPFLEGQHNMILYPKYFHCQGLGQRPTLTYTQFIPWSLLEMSMLFFISASTFS